MRDTRHVRHFRLFQGSEKLVFVDRMPNHHFCRFCQTPLFSAGGKDPVWQKQVVDLPVSTSEWSQV